MVYRWEWLSDLAIIPAWECFLAGVIVGMLITIAIYKYTNKGGAK